MDSSEMNEGEIHQIDSDDVIKEEDETENEEGEDLTEDAEALKAELAKIVVHPPSYEQSLMEEFDQAEFSPSYKDNLPKENLVLQYAENFRRQMVQLYRDRKPLFLNPVNECGVEKFVCTTIRPTLLEFKELYNWDGAAEFVADYLNIEPLKPEYELPKRLISPSTVLKRQKGNCFEYSTLLCSLLIGAGYDAYVISGYATKETCLADESRDICPLLKKKEEVQEEARKKEMKKYNVKPPRDLRSKFELKQEAKKEAEKQAEKEKQRKEEEERIAELEKPPPDPYFGLRIHAWVLVLSGKREVPENFFIEPFTGLSHPMDSSNYLGIESVWNNVNYWVNMQDCSEGVKGLSFDLGDSTVWEFMFPNNDKPLLKIPDAEDDLNDMDDDEKTATSGQTRENTQMTMDDEEHEVEKYLDMPPSWVDALKLSHRDFQMRCPHGKKTKVYKRAKLEKFAHYLMKDGLISRLSVYEDRELTDLMKVHEYYAHRSDKLTQKLTNHRTGQVCENFDPGRPRCLKEHQFKSSTPGPENERVMIFYHEARVDGLVKREETQTEMTEEYSNRDDFLFYKYVEFGKRAKKFGPQETSSANKGRPINKMIQKFHRNRNKPANEDIAEIIFHVAEDKIHISYHTEDVRIAASTREFLKPPNWDEKGAVLTFNPEMHQTFQVDPMLPMNKQVELYEMLMELLKAEEKCRNEVRDSQNEVRNILDDRTKEEAASELDISVYDTERNEKAKKHRRELERQQLEEKMRKQEMDIDYLAPFLAKIGNPEKLSKQQAFSLKEECLADLKQRLIDKANLIQARFEKESQELEKKQAWYQQNQVSMGKEDEEEYLTYCKEAIFRIHILDLRLTRHKEQAPHKYMQLEQKLRNDERLSEFF
ncbi:dynein regulatory complex subunit 7-like isoform X1 [Crassostrea angulata]|uniref:dynein regulatory complex subunit 7 isoform X1 n=1 Tax=Magallana gigas TaxID=29159 RepID=UPI0022B21696|nr:dynein regulatory complex subunit 7-like isoform X1 [Crassostrea angulata]